MNHYNLSRFSADPLLRERKRLRESGYRANMTPAEKLADALYQKEYQARRKAEIKATKAAYYRANKAAINADNAERKKADPEWINTVNGNRRAKKKGAPGKIRKADRLALLEAAGYKCEKCGDPEKLSIDHIVALENDGTNWPCNLQVLCCSCNSAKQTRTEVWLDGQLVGSR